MIKSFQGVNAFITGGASGIGFSLAQRLSELGVRVCIADIQADELEKARERLLPINAATTSFCCDVSDAGSMKAAAAFVDGQLGPLHLLCNNAGVSRRGFVEDITLQDWNWVLDVNLRGLVHGLKAFLPGMKSHGQPAHIVNTSSIAGLVGSAQNGPYTASKFAIVGLSEVLREELASTPIGVSVLCPSVVRTAMLVNGRNRPSRYGGPFDIFKTDDPESTAKRGQAIQEGLSPLQVADHVIAAIENDRFLILTHKDRAFDWQEKVVRQTREASEALGLQ